MFIREKNGELVLSIISPVRFSVDMQLRRATIRGERISFRLNQIHRIEGGNPLGFDKANVHSSCTLDFIRTRYSFFSRSN